MTRRVVILLAAGLFFSAVCWGESKTLALKDGQVVTGEVVETADGYQVTLKSGITVTYAKSQVVSVRSAESPRQEFEKKFQAAAEANTADAYYQAADWAFRSNLIDDAKKALDAGLKINPQHTRSKYLLKQINAMANSAGAKTGSETRPVTTGGGTTVKEEPVQKVEASDKMYLGEGDINRIRQVELREKDNVMIDFRRDSLNRFLSSLPQQGRQAFSAKSAGSKAYGILHANPMFAPDIFVRTDPQFMVDFQRKVWPKIRQSCAAATCHGGEKPRAGLKFYNPPASSARVDYTNFLILVSFIKGNERLVDRSNPESSLLLNFMLPPEQSKAQLAHPKKFTPVLKGKETADYKEVLAWISALAYPPVPDYHVEWKPASGIRLEGFGGEEPSAPPANDTPASAPASAPAPSDAPRQ